MVGLWRLPDRSVHLSGVPVTSQANYWLQWRVQTLETPRSPSSTQGERWLLLRSDRQHRRPSDVSRCGICDFYPARAKMEKVPQHQFALYDYALQSDKLVPWKSSIRLVGVSISLSTKIWLLPIIPSNWLHRRPLCQWIESTSTLHRSSADLSNLQRQGIRRLLRIGSHRASQRLGHQRSSLFSGLFGLLWWQSLLFHRKRPDSSTKLEAWWRQVWIQTCNQSRRSRTVCRSYTCNWR